MEATSLTALRSGMFVSPKQSGQDTRTADDLMMHIVYYYFPTEVGTAEVTPCVSTYTLRCQDSHNPQHVNIPNRYVTFKKLKRHNE